MTEKEQLRHLCQAHAEMPRERDEARQAALSGGTYRAGLGSGLYHAAERRSGGETGRFLPLAL
jgi:hypothetical protein